MVHCISFLDRLSIAYVRRFLLLQQFDLNISKANALPRIIHYLGPRYAGSFQDPHLIFKHLTYEASTSLNMLIVNLTAKNPNSEDLSLMMKAVKNGLGITQASIIFLLSPGSFTPSYESSTWLPSTTPHSPFLARNGTWSTEGDVFVAQAKCLDMAMWKIGGAAVALRLVQLANVSYMDFYNWEFL